MPTLPSAPRIPYNRPEIDATLVSFSLDGSSFVTADQSQMDIVAGETDTSWLPPIGSRGRLALLLPPFTLAGLFANRDEAAVEFAPQYSLDTTNGVDGTWTDVPGYVTPGQQAKPEYREDLLVVSPEIPDVVGIRYGASTSESSAWNEYVAFHVYGYLQGDDRLELWDPTLDQRLPGDHFDLGLLARSSGPFDTTFRVKNRSATKTANTVTLTQYVDTDATDPLLGWHSLSDDGVSFGAGPLALGNLAAGAISPVLTLRRDPSATADLGYWSAKLIAAADSWA